jgi:hypothetical protein
VRGVVVNFGDPFSIPKIIDGRRVTSGEATRLIMTRIAGLLPERYRGVYARDAAVESAMDATSAEPE